LTIFSRYQPQAAMDIENGVASIQTLKRRRPGIVCRVPLRPDLLDELNATFALTTAQRDPEFAKKKIRCFSRTTAWRYVKAIMAAAGKQNTM
jgi:hypothetical protein